MGRKPKRFDPLAAEPSRRLTMGQVVGENVRTIRQAQGRSQAQLAEALAPWGLTVSQSTVALIETGKRGISVDDLLSLGLALGVAPHVLLYPPAETEVGTEGRRRLLDGPDLAEWLMSPDTHERSTATISEDAVWFDSAMLDYKLDAETLAKEGPKLRGSGRSLKQARKPKAPSKPTGRGKR